MNARASTSRNPPVRSLRGVRCTPQRFCVVSRLLCQRRDQDHRGTNKEKGGQPQQDLRYQIGHPLRLGNLSYVQISKRLHLKHLRDSVSLLGKVPSELPDRDSGEHVPDARMQSCRDIARQSVAGSSWQPERVSSDQKDAEYRESGRDGASGDADELARLHSAASDLILRGCPGPSGNRTALLTPAE